jgi:hypothetical protein
MGDSYPQLVANLAKVRILWSEKIEDNFRIGER